MYVAVSGHDAFPKHISLSIPKLPHLPSTKFPSLSDVAKGIISGAGGDAQGDGVHPIDQLITNAEKEFKRAASREATSLADAAAKYRNRHGRHPPPGFDAWYDFAVEKGAVVVEDFFDQIYHDLEPLRYMAPPELRHQAHVLSPGISIRSGNVTTKPRNTHARLDLWADMLKTLARHKHVKLPDVDIPVNFNDGPALVVPWEQIDTALSFARRMRPAPAEVVQDFSGLDDIDFANFTFPFDPEWLADHYPKGEGAFGPTQYRPYWSLVTPACPIRSSSRAQDTLVDIWHARGHMKGHIKPEHDAVNLLPTTFPAHSLRGYARNWTLATDLCSFPYLQGLHGAFVAPKSISASQKLFPIFSSGKFSINNDIILPGALEWNNTRIFAESSEITPWNERTNKLFWRGPATGGNIDSKNWQRFQRHRFVAMLNATQVAIAEESFSRNSTTVKGVAPGKCFRIPHENPYKLEAQKERRLADWVASWANAAFTSETCEHGVAWNDACMVPKYFAMVAPARPGEQEKYKYVAVLDGNGRGHAGELARSLKSGAMTLRASLYRNWYDARLWPWVHYVPIDSTFIDVYGIMDYFVGSTGATTPSDRKKEHDTEARRIAKQGREWAEKVMRSEDMLAYVYRLLLEYARLVDDKRERLGWVGDLLEQYGR